MRRPPSDLFHGSEALTSWSGALPLTTDFVAISKKEVVFILLSILGVFNHLHIHLDLNDSFKAGQ
jgi:hypothetical protein